MNTKKILNIFIVSSFVAMVTMIYIGNAFKNSGRPSHVPYELFPIFIPVLYGIFGLVNNYVGEKYSFLVGASMGLLLSLIGRFILNLPIKIFKFTKDTASMVHLYAMLLYGLIFQFIVTPLVNYIV
jgi:hypothetical protein